MEAKDEELLKQFVALARKLANQELSRQDAKATIQARSYRDLETLHLGTDLHHAARAYRSLVSFQPGIRPTQGTGPVPGRSNAKDSLALSEKLGWT